MLQQVVAIKLSLLWTTVRCFVTSFGIPLNLAVSVLSDNNYPHHNNIFNLFLIISYIISFMAIFINPWLFALQAHNIWKHLKQNCCKERLNIEVRQREMGGERGSTSRSETE